MTDDVRVHNRHQLDVRTRGAETARKPNMRHENDGPTASKPK